MLEYIFLHSLAVFGVTLLVTKSSLFASKREYVIKRWEQSKKIGFDSAIIKFLHYFWYKMHTCSMCLGGWIALFFVLTSGCYSAISGYPAIFGLNWLFHCVEDYLYSFAESAKTRSERD